MHNFAVSGRERRQALKRRGRENPISMLVLAKPSSILKNMFLSKKSFFFFCTASQLQKKERRKIKYKSVKEKKTTRKHQIKQNCNYMCCTQV